MKTHRACSHLLSPRHVLTELPGCILWRAERAQAVFLNHSLQTGPGRAPPCAQAGREACRAQLNESILCLDSKKSGQASANDHGSLAEPHPLRPQTLTPPSFSFLPILPTVQGLETSPLCLPTQGGWSLSCGLLLSFMSEGEPSKPMSAPCRPVLSPMHPQSMVALTGSFNYTDLETGPFLPVSVPHLSF